MQKSGFLHALLLDGSGGAKHLTVEEVSQWVAEDGVLWLHFDYSFAKVEKWIRNDKQLDSVSKAFLLTEDKRPKVSSINNCLLVALRGVNMNIEADPEDMVGVRMWVSEFRIITTIRRNLETVSDMMDVFASNVGPKNSGEFIIDFADRLISRMEPTLEGIEERLADLEEETLATGDAKTRRELSNIRRESIVLRRHIAPQREAMVKLYDEKISWFHEKERLYSREIADHLYRYIDNIDSIRERATVIHEELVSNLSEQLNSRMYVLSLVTVIFLPLGLLTGLFGINLGGIPGAASNYAFTVFVCILFVMALGLLLFLKKKQWM